MRTLLSNSLNNSKAIAANEVPGIIHLVALSIMTEGGKSIDHFKSFTLSQSAVKDIDIVDEPHHAMFQGAGADRVIKLRRGVPATIKASYLYRPVKDEDRSRVSISITDVAANEVAHSPTDTIVFTPQNTAAEYTLICTMLSASEGQAASTITRKIKTKANGVLAIEFVDKPEKIRPGTNLKFRVKKMEFSTLIDAANFELEAVKWNLNGVEVGRGGTLLLDGQKIKQEGDYVVEAFVNVADAYNIGKKIINTISEHGDAVKFSVQSNRIIRIEGPKQMISGKEYDFKAIPLIKDYNQMQDGRVTWNVRDHDASTPLICEKVYATGAGNIKVIATMGSSQQTLDCKVAPGQINRWCFTGTDNECKTKAGWKETINAVICCPGAAGASVEVHLLEKDDNIRDIVKMRAVKFDKNDTARFTIKMEDIKTKAQSISKGENGVYKLFFGIPKTKDGIQFDGMKIQKAGDAAFYVPAIESRQRGNEKNVLLEVDNKPEILLVQFTDSKGEPANKVYNYGEKIKITIKSKNLTGDEIRLHLIEISQVNSQFEIGGGARTIKVDESETTTFVLDTNSSYIKAQSKLMEMECRSFYYRILAKENKLVFPNDNNSNPVMKNIANAAALQRFFLSGNADVWNNMQNSAGLVVVGDNAEVAGDNEKGVCVYEARVRAFMRMLRVGEWTTGESGYSRLFAGRKIDDLSTHPQTVYKGSSAAGAYQIMRYTWWWLNGQELDAKNNRTGIYKVEHDYIKRYKIPDFSAESQDRLCIIIMKYKQKGLLELVINGEIEKAIRNQGSGEWASLPHIGDKSRHMYKGKPQPATPMKKCLSDYEVFLKKELDGSTDLHLKKGFLEEFGYTCCNKINVEKNNNGKWHDPMNDCQRTKYSFGGNINPEGGAFGKVRNSETKNHQGIDLFAMPGKTNIYAAVDGTIVENRLSTSGGNVITIKVKDKQVLIKRKNEINYSIQFDSTGDKGEQETGSNFSLEKDKNFYVRYYHLSESKVEKGEAVFAGQLIGISGATGNADGTRGPHLHFEILNTTSYPAGLSNRMNPTFFIRLNPINDLIQDEEKKYRHYKDNSKK